MSNANFTKVGALSIAMIIFFLLSDFFITGKGLFNQSTKLYIFVNEANSLNPETPISFRGLKIGKVSDLQGYHGNLLMELSIDKEMKLPKSTEFYCSQVGLFGDQQIDVKIKEERNGFYKNGDTISTYLVYRPMENLVDSNFLKAIEPSLKELSKTVGEALIKYSESIDTTNY
ncbi:MAG: MlaD family protein [Saprospiraceae bacterium]